jgi:hypothetical protein
MPEDIQLLQRLLDRFERKTEEIEAVRQKLARLEDERKEIRQQMTAYFEDEIETKDVEAARAETELILGPDYYDERRQRMAAQTAPTLLRPDGLSELQGQAKSLRDTVEAVARLGGLVTAARLAAELAISSAAARLRLSRATGAGLLQRTEPGKYVRANSPEDEDISF